MHFVSVSLEMVVGTNRGNEIKGDEKSDHNNM